MNIITRLPTAYERQAMTQSIATSTVIKKRLAFVLLAITALLLTTCQEAHAITDSDIDRLIPALIKVESGGDDSAIGDSGNAVGCLQICPVMVADVNRISGKAYTLKDRYSRAKSVEMAKIYLRHYCRRLNLADSARCWNGGPRGHTKAVTIKYWVKVRKEL